MNSRFLLIPAIAALLACNHKLSAQATWTVGNTILTETDLVTGINVPWEISWGPDDYIWCTLRTGKVLRIDPASGNYTTLLDISGTYSSFGVNSEPGLLGMALSPEWSTNPRVFLAYNYKVGNTFKERLVAYTFDGAALINEEILINAIPGGGIHNGSRLIITPDNKILMTTGDTDNSGIVSQDMSSLGGKTLRVNLDGSIPSDNPDPASYVWSFGHRNSQGLCVGPDGIIYSSEHGWNSSDEFNIIEPGRNYGWKTVQGACNTAAEITYCDANNVKEPILEWTPCVAVNGIEYYNHPAIPEWQHSVIMGVMGGLGGANGNNDRVSVLHLSADGLTIESEDQYFTSLNQRFRDVCVNPYTGSVYVALNGANYPGSGPNKIKEFKNLAFTPQSVLPITDGQLFEMFPNPASDRVTIDVSPSLIGQTMAVYSYDGSLVLEEVIRSTRQELNISNLNIGNYWAIISSSLGTVTNNFVKK